MLAIHSKAEKYKSTSVSQNISTKTRFLLTSNVAGGEVFQGLLTWPVDTNDPRDILWALSSSRRNCMAFSFFSLLFLFPADAVTTTQTARLGSFPLTQVWVEPDGPLGRPALCKWDYWEKERGGQSWQGGWWLWNLSLFTWDWTSLGVSFFRGSNPGPPQLT